MFIACTSSNAQAASTANGTAVAVSSARTTDISTLLTAAHGAPPPVCALAARSIESLQWRDASSDAPSTPLRDEQLALQRTMDEARNDGNRGTVLFTAAEQQLLLENFSNPDRCVRELSVRLLATTRRTTAMDGISSALVERLRAVDVTTREAATLGLGLLSPTNATSALLAVLRDPSASVRANAAWALGRIDDGRALGGLMDAMRDRDERVRVAAVTALGQLDSTAAIDALIGVLERDSVAAVRRVAAWALSELNAESSVRSLAQTLRNDRDAGVREMCAWALGQLDSHDGIDELLAALRRDQSPKVRETSAWALGQLHDERAADLLGEALTTDTDKGVRGTSAWATGQLHIKSAPSGLVKALTDADEVVRFKASWALSEIRDERTVPAVRSAFEKESLSGARRAQLRLLLSFGEQSESLLKELLLSPDSNVREAAVRGLAGRTRVNPWPWPAPRPRPFP